MNELERARLRIDEIDKKMRDLFCQRMDAAAEVAEYKKARGLPVYVPEREAEVIAKNAANVEDAAVRSYYTGFIGSVMKISREYQNSLINGVKVAFSGTQGAFAHIAAMRLFPQGDLKQFRDFKEAYDSVVEGDCECAVLPIENSFAGEVGTVADLIFRGPLYINDVIDITVKQNLLGVKGATEQTVKTVISHPQALSQCAEYLSKRGYETKEFANTALAAKYAAEQNDVTLAAVGTEEAAEIFGLTVLARSINSSTDNKTRFVVMSRAENTLPGRKNDNFFLVFSVKNQAGALAQAINIIGRYGYNMISLHSRPMQELAWQYYFYMECEGDIRSENGAEMMKELSGLCDKLKIVGSYRGIR